MNSTESVFRSSLFAAVGVLALAGCATQSASTAAPASTLAAVAAAPATPAEPPFVPQPQANPAARQAFPVTTNAEPPGARENPAIIPVEQGGTDGRHLGFVAAGKQAGNIDVLFLGDSITDFWNTRGKEVFQHYYGQLKTLNFGINAARTQNIIWRLQNGEGGGFSPKVVVLMIGTNNTGVVSRTAVNSAWRNTNAEAAEGVIAIVTDLRKDFPDAKILLLGIFPRGDDAVAMQQIPEINKAIAKLDDQKHVFYLDLTPKFLGGDGQINPDYFQLADRLHPTPAGYVVWAEGMKDLLAKLLK